MGKIDKLITLVKLGPVNLARVGMYRLGLRTKLHPSLSIVADMPVGVFYQPGNGSLNNPILIPRSDWKIGELRYFGRSIPSPAEGVDPPAWHGPAGIAIESSCANDPWWTIKDFDLKVGDIKCVWELSRFDWVLAFAQRAMLGNSAELQRLNSWIEDWVNSNRPYLGRNWKCGQEASIRVMNLLMAAHILNSAGKSTDTLRELVELHLKRIAPTMAYALGQSNNHGTSEAAALYIGGAWLGGANGERWSKIGRRWLIERSQKLIEKDGTFSQYSINYHRLMLDTYSFCESFRRQFGLKAFPPVMIERLAAATSWLEQMVHPETGDVPTIGPNDGAHILSLSECGYRDYRSSVQWGSVLFRGCRAYGEGAWDQQLHWLGVKLPNSLSDKPGSVSLSDGGFQVLRNGCAVAYHRYPKYRFRPSQADALHCDFWVAGVNVLRDAGTFSYNVSEEDTEYFNGTKAHNTVEFDDRDQMPRYGRFLFGRWLKPLEVENVITQGGVVAGQAGYVDYLGARHVRKLELGSNKFIVTDTLSGFDSKAVLRWRLQPGNWKLIENSVNFGKISINVTANVPIKRLGLIEGFESRYYLEKNKVPVLEVELQNSGVFTTTVIFNS